MPLAKKPQKTPSPSVVQAVKAGYQYVKQAAKQLTKKK